MLRGIVRSVAESSPGMVYKSMNAAVVNKTMQAVEACIGKTISVTAKERLYVGVDLGTAYIVVLVLNSKKQPVACALEFAHVVKDGLVVDYTGAIQIVRRLVGELEKRLGRKLEFAATAIPPGTGDKDSGTHRYVVESANLEVISVLDEPTAANAVLGLADGAIVDIGGGTTGISILEKGKVSYVGDEPTGGTHMSLVLAGHYGISLEQAEQLKKNPEQQKEIFPVVLPVLQKMGSIVTAHVRNRSVSGIYLVGGTCCLLGIEDVISKETGICVHKPSNPFLVTPMGIALSCDS